MTRTPTARPKWLYILLAPYAAGVVGMAALVADPTPAIDPSSSVDQIRLFRGLFALAGLLSALILLGALRRWRGVARGATLLHLLVSAVALTFLVRAVASDEPLTGSMLFELVAKFAVHATLAWLWTRRVVLRAVSRDAAAPNRASD